MVTVGSKELKNRLGEYLRMVREGRAVQITDRGNPIACLIPARSREASEEAERLASLVARGAVTLGSGRIAPAKPTKWKPGPGIIEMLNDERR